MENQIFSPAANGTNSRCLGLSECRRKYARGRQRQILTLVSQGKTNAAIAAEIGLSPRTVEAHRLRLTRTLGLANSAELLASFLNSEQ